MILLFSDLCKKRDRSTKQKQPLIQSPFQAAVKNAICESDNKKKEF